MVLELFHHSFMKPTLKFRKGGILLANKEINEGVKATNNRMCMYV